MAAECGALKVQGGVVLDQPASPGPGSIQAETASGSASDAIGACIASDGSSGTAAARVERDLAVRLAEQERIASGFGQPLIGRIFAISLVLQSAPSSDRLLSERVRDAVSRLDDLISEVRRVVFDLAPPGPSLVRMNGARLLDADPAADLRKRAGEVLTSAGLTLNEMWSMAASDPGVDREVVEELAQAGRLLQHAVIALSSQPAR